MKNRLLDFSIKYKLGGLGLLYTIALLVVIGMGWNYYNNIHDIGLFKEKVYEAVKGVQDVRVQEKAYLQFYTSEHQAKLKENAKHLVQKLKNIAQDTDDAQSQASVRKIQGDFKNYQALFDKIVAIHENYVTRSLEAQDLLNRVYGLIDKTIEEINYEQFEAQMMGEELPVEKLEALAVARDCKIYLYKLTTLQQQFLMTGEEPVLEAYGEYAVGPDAKALMALEQFSYALKDEEKIRRSKEVVVSVEKFTGISRENQDLFKQDKVVARDLDGAGNKIITAANKLLSSAAKKADEVKSSAITAISIIVVATIVLCAFFAVAIVRNITGPLSKSVAFAKAVAGGDFSQTLDIDQKDETGVLADALRAMVGNLKAGLEDVKEKQAEAARAEGMLGAAEKLEGVVERLTAASEALTERIESVGKGVGIQDERVTQTVTAMEEMNATVMEVAKNASDAAEGANVAKDKALGGREVVEKAMRAIGKVDTLAKHLEEAMDELSEQANSIGNIINVISDIADQTNLLALNAAIEAARAGEAGRGFAVVADEVRKLAEKTMSATTEVGQAIDAVQKGIGQNVTKVKEAAGGVDEATTLAKESSAALQEIVPLVENSSGQVQSIAAASEEQSVTAGEINRSVEEISRISSEIAEGMSESSQAVDDLAEQAANLKNIILAFKTEGRQTESKTESKSESKPKPRPKAEPKPEVETGVEAEVEVKVEAETEEKEPQEND